VHFDSHDLGGDPMGYMVENRQLRRALYLAIEASNSIELKAPAVIETLEFESSDVQIMIEDSDPVSAQLVVAADGRNSFCRKLAGIDTTQITYSQKAIVTTVHHEKPHHGVAHELFLPAGPFAILPLTDNRSSIVWTDSPKAVDAAMALPEKMFEAELGRRFGDFLGMVAPCAPRWAYPLSLQLAERYTGSRLALLGDAAHVIHPIAGQGLNMGLRDAAALADVVGAALSRGLDPGGAAITEYGQWRNFDNHMLAGATDVLNRLFSNDVAPVKHVRRLGLGMVNRISPLRTFFMSEASGQIGELPSLLRIR
jgi:2-octaprenyl-6-methoxyphenol hydroxylase